MPLVAKRKLRETWREATAARLGAGSDLAAFDDAVRAGQGEAEAAYRTLAAAGRLWVVDEPGPPEASAARAEVPPV